jgi:hypothetical protein
VSRERLRRTLAGVRAAPGPGPFGESAPAAALHEHPGRTAEPPVDAVLRTVARYNDGNGGS